MVMSATSATDPVTGPDHARALIQLTGEFALLIDDRRHAIPHSAERVLAFLALANRPTSRGRVAGTLWTEVAEERAAGNLRTAVWRLRHLGLDLLLGEDDRLALAPSVTVDTIELATLMRSLAATADEEALERVPELLAATDILPGWDDEWVEIDRERFRLLRLEALESAAEAFLERDELGRALEAALGAIHSEPFRESARRLQVRIHLREGNQAEALRACETYRNLLVAEIGLEPSPAMLDLVRPLLERRTASSS